MYIWKLEDSLQVWVLAYHVGPGDQIRSPSLAASTFTFSFSEMFFFNVDYFTWPVFQDTCWISMNDK